VHFSSLIHENPELDAGLHRFSYTGKHIGRETWVGLRGHGIKIVHSFYKKDVNLSCQKSEDEKVSMIGSSKR
jgi:hypothetical protein